MKILDIDGPLITLLSKMADMMWLTILTMICCIPVITVGASLTALNYVALKMARNEEGYVTRSFFKAFKENFKQSTAIWLIFVLIFGFLGADYYIIHKMGTEINQYVQMLLVVVAVFAVFAFVMVWPVQAKFANTVRRTIVNAFVISVAKLRITIPMIIIYAIPFLLWLFVQPLIPQLLPILFVFWLSIPAYLSAKLYDKFFRTMEEKILAEQAAANAEEGDSSEEEDTRIFKDELDESLKLGQND